MDEFKVEIFKNISFKKNVILQYKIFFYFYLYLILFNFI